jgi:hypothetical protein
MITYMSEALLGDRIYSYMFTMSLNKVYKLFFFTRKKKVHIFIITHKYT